MALIEYDIQYANGKSSVTYKVIEVDTNDRIRFTSTYSGVGIEYQNDSPFTDPKAPKANVPFPVNGITAKFKVKKRLTDKTRIHFDCGELASGMAPGQIKEYATPKLIPSKGANGKKGGNGTPPDF